MKQLHIRHLGPIEEAKIELGDLTFLIGPQASGKSLLLETLKFMIDRDNVINTLDRYNYIIGHNTNKILNMYYGEGMSTIWDEQTSITMDGKTISRTKIAKQASSEEEHVFYVPAQRILSISDGRPKNFMEFDTSTPYVVRSFSETLRLFMQHGLGKANTIFPHDTRLKRSTRRMFNEHIFHNAKVVMEEQTGQKKMKLHIGNINIPFMAWSAGQKEFMPLLLAFYCLTGAPSKVVKKEGYKYVIIEEPEMGLHPRAIVSVLLQILELVSNGYKVVVSTHSPLFLDFTWVFNQLKEQGAKEGLLQLFDLPTGTAASKIFDNLLDRELRAYYFKHNDQGKVQTKDISLLDLGSEDIDMSEWGGLSSFASKAAEVVAHYAAV